MLEFLTQAFERLIDQTVLDSKRYLYPHFKLGRLVGLVGPRGVGKTTLLLQFIKENLYQDKKTFYFSADNLSFQQTTLLAFINELYLTAGYRTFFIDEIHRYKNWNQELKNLYDAFPDISIVFSGSSMLDLVKGSYDLSRRATLYRLPGLSLREYITFAERQVYEKIDAKKLFHNPKDFSHLGSIPKLKGFFRNYLAHGYYPFYFEDPDNFHQRVYRTIEKTIYEDIANFYNLKTENLSVFIKILTYLATISPGEVNTNNIAKNLNLAHNTVDNYISILSEVNLLRAVHKEQLGNPMLRKPAKIFLNNTTLLTTLSTIQDKPFNLGSLRELFFLQATQDAGESVFYSKKGDYQSSEFIFEIGGKNKTRKQIKDIPKNGLLVKDDILMPQPHQLPLVYCGFLY